ncbi:MAG: GtrA family protein [Clostridia bacterium]|nr:GtrA family protein [Clostridia bacterium]
MTREQRKEALRALKFLLISISAGLIQIGSFTLLKEVFGLVYWQAYLISLVLSVVWNFTFNRRYTFQSAVNIPKAMALVALFYCVFTPLSTWWGHALDQAGVNNYLIEGGTMVINFITEFLYQRFVVFRGSLDTNARAKREKKETA